MWHNETTDPDSLRFRPMGPRQIVMCEKFDEDKWFSSFLSRSTLRATVFKYSHFQLLQNLRCISFCISHMTYSVFSFTYWLRCLDWKLLLASSFLLCFLCVKLTLYWQGRKKKEACCSLRLTSYSGSASASCCLFLTTEDSHVSTFLKLKEENVLQKKCRWLKKLWIVPFFSMFSCLLFFFFLNMN